MAKQCWYDPLHLLRSMDASQQPTRRSLSGGQLDQAARFHRSGRFLLHLMLPFSQGKPPVRVQLPGNTVPKSPNPGPFRLERVSYVGGCYAVHLQSAKRSTKTAGRLDLLGTCLPGFYLASMQSSVCFLDCSFSNLLFSPAIVQQ